MEVSMLPAMRAAKLLPMQVIGGTPIHSISLAVECAL